LGTVEGWQKVFFLIGLSGLLVVPLVLLTLSEPLRRGFVRSQPGGDGTALPLREVAAYARANWKVLATHDVGFALLSFSSYGSGAWLPEMFKRVHGWDAVSFGLVYGLVVFIGSASGAISGGVIADRLARWGYRDSKVRVGWMAAWAWLPFGVSFPLIDNGSVAIVVIVPAAFLASMPFGVAPAALQEMVPNNLRGQISAIYLCVVNLIGLAIGPLALALCTDYLFTEARFGLSGIRRSLLSTTTAAHVAAAGLLWVGMSEFEKALDRRDVPSG
jgi:hypothetical protein